MSGRDKNTILVVDDERSMREFLQILLSREGYEVTLAPSGEDAIDILQGIYIDGGFKFVEMARQWRLHQDTVNIRTVIQIVYQAKQIFSGIIGRAFDDLAVDSRFLARLGLAVDIDL